ncbi:unnamed protein product [Prorocentrum cordatum]|uniref:Uncharacterized protein n=1 Tax=Prorocentrum cordatum TaxID=2364126 RepID=A0ABN9ULZ3_9DINO|nr:unnamed protein product [Polarella glacialis]
MARHKKCGHNASALEGSFRADLLTAAITDGSHGPLWMATAERRHLKVHQRRSLSRRCLVGRAPAVQRHRAWTGCTQRTAGASRRAQLGRRRLPHRTCDVPRMRP